MLRNWLVVALRSLLRHPTFSLINILGLAIGLASCMLILMHVRDELSYDRWVADADRIYRVHTTYKLSGRSDFRTVRSAGRMKDAFLASYPGAVEDATRLANFNSTLVVAGEAFAQAVTYADPNVLDLFGLPLLRGDPATALSDPSGILLTPETARRLFGDADPLGRTLTLCCIGPERFEYRVVGILAPLPETTHLAIQVLAPIVPERFAAFPNILDTWTSVNVYTYLKLAADADIEVLRRDNPAFVDRHIQSSQGGRASDSIAQEFVAIPDIRLHTREQAGDMGDLKPSGDWSLVAGLTLVAGLILGLGCINFVNMAIARSTLRAREVAVRKVLGASRGKVMAQFLGEALFLAVLAGLVALVLVELALPPFNGLLGKELDWRFDDPAFWAMLGGLLGLVGLLGGVYPALHVARFRPAGILKGEPDRSLGGAAGLRTGLVVVQFAIAIGLTTVTAVVYHQTLFASHADLGFQREGIVAFRALGNAVPASQRNAFVEEVRRLPEVRGAVLSSDVPTDNRENNSGFTRADGSGEAQSLNYLSFDHGFFELYGIRPVAGRTFDPAYGTDTIRRPAEGTTEIQNASAVLNEAAVRLLGYDDPAAAVGSVLTTTFFGNVPFRLTIVGVIPDIRFRSLKHDVQPTIMFNRPDLFNTLSVRVAGVDEAAVLAKLEALWRSHIPGIPFNARYLDDMIASLYGTERVQGIIFATFAGLAVMVACLGLYGLSAFAAQRRTKEIGIRKVFGASVRQLVQLLVWQFSRPVLLANLVAWPVAWWFLSGWLEGFERRIDLSPFYFLGAGLLALTVTALTVAGHAARVARAKPVAALRYE